jgi:FkbH-like protein
MVHPFDQIKVVIWDLDETLWQGTLTEGKVSLPAKHREAVRFLTDAGVMNSICSKNDFERAERELTEMGIWDCFVFSSIDWTAKGPRLARQIQEMQLRAQNVLFLDDNHLNLEEAKYFCPGIMTGSPADIEALWAEARQNREKDSGHSRLKHYQVLEKRASAQKDFPSNESFLFSSAIQVTIHEDCLAEADRIHELIARTNQLNFTKKRIELEELKTLLRDKNARAGYVTVNDRFGEYGISGFFAVKNGEMEHFLFSCRTLGMGVEQYVYNFLGRPKMQTNGEVISDLSSKELPKWINQNGAKQRTEKLALSKMGAHSVLLKGPCDLEQIFPFVEAGECIDTEFTYVSPTSGVAIESISHTTHIVESLRLTEEQQRRVIGELPFADERMYSDLIFKHPYRVVFVSILPDANLGVYRRKETGELVAFAQAHYPLTDPKCHEGYSRGEYYTARCKLTKEFLEEFARKYDFIGCNSAEKIIENLRAIRARLLPECLLVVLLGSETYYEKNTKPAYVGRHLTHKRINDAVKQLAAEVPNVQCLDVNPYITGQGSFHNSFGHFIKPVYYGMAEEAVEIINHHTGAAVKKSGKGKMLYHLLRQKVETILS